MSDSSQHDQCGAAASEPKSPEEIRAEIEQTREELGDAVEALAAKSDVKGQAKDRIASAQQTITDNITQARETITGKTDDLSAKAKQATPESASAGAQQLGSAVKENPLPVTAMGAFVAGLIIGWILGRR